MGCSCSIWRGTSDAVTASETLILGPHTALFLPSPRPSPARTCRYFFFLSLLPGMWEKRSLRILQSKGWGRMDSPISYRAALPCPLCRLLNSPRTTPHAQRDPTSWKAGCGETFSPQPPSSSSPDFFLCWKDSAACWVLLMSQRAKP